MDLSKLIEEVYNSETEAEREEYGKRIANGIMEDEVKLVQVVEALGSRLTSTAVDDRILGMGLLGHILENLKSDFLSETELDFIVEFLHDRLKDQQLVIPKVIRCILPVVQCSNLPEGCCSKLLLQLFQEANIQSHSQRHRRAFFLIVQHLLQKRLDEIKQLGSEFVMNFLQAMDGEKDPRNLLLLFDMIPTILTHFPLGPFVEDFFEILSMYFPIDFSPTVGGPDAEVTTRAELAKRLHTCMSQTNQFSEYLVPLTLEKLESSIIEAKLDALNLLEMCCERSYLAEDLQPHLPSIWHALRREIFMSKNEDVEKAANAFLRYAFKRLSQNEEILEESLKLIFSECRHHLSEPELRLSQPASKILCSAAAGSEVSCARVISMTLPFLYEQFTTKTSNPERRGVLGIMITMMAAIRPFPTLRLSVLLSNWDEVLWMWFSLLSHSHDHFVLLSLHAFLTLLDNESEKTRLAGMEDQHSDIDEKNRELLQAHMLSILQKDQREEQDEDGNQSLLPQITSQVIKTMRVLALKFPDEFLKSSVPTMLDLVGQDNLSADEISGTKMKKYLLSLSSVSASVPVAKVVIPNLMKILVQRKTRNESYDLITETLLSIVDSPREKADEMRDLMNCVAAHLTTLVGAGLEARKNNKAVLYGQIAGIVRTLIQNSGREKQQELINSYWNQQPPEDNKRIDGMLREAFLASVHPSVDIADKDDLIKSLVEKVFSTPPEDGMNEDIKGSSAPNGTESPQDMDSLADIRLFASFLNKAEENEFSMLLAKVEGLLTEELPVPAAQPETEPKSMNLDDAGDRISPAEEATILNLEQISNELPTATPPPASNRIRNIVTFFSWTVKALAVRGYENLDDWVQVKMIRMLNSPVYGKWIAEGFSVLMSDSPESLNPKSFCNFRFLYKQRVFQLSIPKLVEGYRQAKQEVKPNFIRALTGQLTHVPEVVLKMELNNVVPLLVGSLEYQLPEEEEKAEVVISRNAGNAPLLLSSLTALQELLNPASSSSDAGSTANGNAKSSPLLEYYADLVPRLLRLSRYLGFMKVRILALKCLQRCAKFPIHMMVPIKESVIFELRPCLDDPKRLVRKEAVLCKNIWTLTNAPGGM